MIKTIKLIIKQIFCRHSYVLKLQYGETNFYKCKKCEHIKLQSESKES